MDAFEKLMVMMKYIRGLRFWVCFCSARVENFGLTWHVQLLVFTKRERDPSRDLFSVEASCTICMRRDQMSCLEHDLFAINRLDMNALNPRSPHLSPRLRASAISDANIHQIKFGPCHTLNQTKTLRKHRLCVHCLPRCIPPAISIRYKRAAMRGYPVKHITKMLAQQTPTMQ